jgi:hypothetical protein
MQHYSRRWAWRTNNDARRVDTRPFTGSYTITQADIDNGSFSNTALASGGQGDPTDPTDDVTDLMI